MKSVKCVAGVDLGASGGRVIVGWIEKNKLSIEEIYRFVNGPTEIDGSLYWDVNRLYDEIIKGLTACAEKGYIPLSVGIDTWGVDYVLFDSEGNEILPTFCYRDARTKEFLDKVDYNELYARTGIQKQTFNTVYQLLADKSSGRLDKAENMLMLPEYFMYKLCGKCAREYTNASTTSLVNVNTREWDYELINKLGLNEKLFAPLKMPGVTLGEFTNEVARKVGYKAKVVLVPTHDTASAVTSSVDDLYISSGTWSLLGIVGDPVLTKEANDAGYTNEGAVDGRIRLLKNIMGMWIIQEMRKEICPDMTWNEIAQSAESVSKTAYDYAFDVNSPDLLAPKSMVSAIKAECVKSGAPEPKGVAEIAFAVYNSLAHYYAQSIADLETLCGRKFNAVNIIGGGSNNMLLNRLTARYTAKTVLAGPSEATAIGNIIVQLETLKLTDKANRADIIKKSFNIATIE